jgi:hypothetical protein
MIVGERVPADLLEGHRHGVLIEFEGGQTFPMTARTKRRARRTWEWVYAMKVEPWRGVMVSVSDIRWRGLVRDAALSGHEVAIYRVESRRIVEQRDLPISGEPPEEAGVREPRQPHPSEGGAAAAAPIPDDE